MEIRPYRFVVLNLLVLSVLCGYSLAVRIWKNEEYSLWTLAGLVLLLNLLCAMRGWRWLREKAFVI